MKLQFFKLLRNARFYFMLSTIITCGVVFYLQSTKRLAMYELSIVQVFALISSLYLYVAVIISPLFIVFPKFPKRALITFLRRPIGVSAFIFGFLHAVLAMNLSLGGIFGLVQLGLVVIVPVACGSAALFILFILAVTSTDWSIKKLGFKNWKSLHRLVHLACVLVLMHALALGSRFAPDVSAVPWVAGFLLLVLVLLHVLATVKILMSKKAITFRSS